MTQSLSEAVAAGLWDFTPSHYDVTWREQLKLFPESNEIKIYFRHADAAIAAYDKWKKEQGE